MTERTRSQYTTCTGHILEIEIGSIFSDGSWFVYGERDGQRTLVADGLAGDADAAFIAARELCQQFDADVARLKSDFSQMLKEKFGRAGCTPEAARESMRHLAAREAAYELIWPQLRESEDDL